MMRQPRQHNDKHLDFIRGLPCICCGDNTSTQAAHVKMADRRAAKRNVGAGEKADDKWTLPLCGDCHNAQHKMGERYFWGVKTIDPIFLCLALWSVSGNHEMGERIVSAAR